MGTKTNIDPDHASVGELSVRYRVTASFIVTLGLYEGRPNTISAIAQNVDDLLKESGGIEDWIDKVEIQTIEHYDSGNTLASSTDS